MSVRAYRINKIQVEKDPTFNLWHDDDLICFLDRQNETDTGYQAYSTDESTRFVCVSVEALENALKDPRWKDDKEIKADVAWAKKKGDNYIDYECY